MGLLDQLAERLEAEGVSYCQWKGHRKRDRWESGAGDIDLLVDSACSQRLCRCLTALGFKPAAPPVEAQVAGTESWFGYDAARGVLLHLHVHFRLIIGSHWTTMYRLPMERAVLASVVPHGPFPVPAPEDELLLFVIRQIQRSGWRDFVSLERPSWSMDVQREFSYLAGRVSRNELVARARALFPSLEMPFIDECLTALRTGATRRERLRLRRGLHARFGIYARRPSIGLLLKRILRRLHLAPEPHGMRFTRGGTVFALLGGDGAGKSTCVGELRSWLADPFDLVTAHLGRPPRSLTTLFVGGLLKLRRTFGPKAEQPGTLELARLACTARDRYLLFQKVRRRAADGGIALCERYPTPHERLLVGPEIARLLGDGRYSWIERRLMRAEQSYYDQITPPDVTMVMLVEPEVAVARKTTEPSDYVWERNTIVWNTDWSATGARVIDAGRPLSEVLADLKTLIWAEV